MPELNILGRVRNSMVGSYKVRVKNNRNEYSFVIKRNITLLCGDSGKGKTTLYEMIEEYNRFGKQSGVSVSCDREIVALSGSDWQSKIEDLKQSIIVIDEDSEFIRSKEFAQCVKGSDNYFLLITRNYLPQLPYSVDEIYKLEGGKNKRFVNVYKAINDMYHDPQKKYLPFQPEVIITEDSKSGFQFFKNIADELGIECISAGGKADIYKKIEAYRNKKVVVIADGAAFGAEMGEIVLLQNMNPLKLGIFLPESFEWLILKSDVIREISAVEELKKPEDYADSKKYMSWEQFFTDLLENNTKDTKYMSYKKDKLKPYYLKSEVIQKVRENCPGMKI